ncbi:hypothetical protein PBCV1_a232R [Paramecium bursaria Chlorella virus 1]|uniref:Uncharacterized protein n=1 Tax=Paramecium bursaria Chlorella virus 1 TaxID=10506 RepID=Q84552_PBCV1|nr:hypothetical protein PBCV1_a232R [Paramecium bursaria Chlorella virus 1]AAC96600.1 hypothetical protein [Paramecium bursaria Chlorella virus 1]
MLHRCITRARVRFISWSRIEIHGIVFTEGSEKCSGFDLTNDIFIQRINFIVLEYFKHCLGYWCFPGVLLYKSLRVDRRNDPHILTEK